MEANNWVFPKKGVGPPNHPFVHRVFHYKPSILGVPLFLETPNCNCQFKVVLILYVFTDAALRCDASVLFQRCWLDQDPGTRNQGHSNEVLQAIPTLVGDA